MRFLFELRREWFNFDGLLFDTGKSILKVESEEQIDKNGAILKAFPKVKIKIGGYPDTGGIEKSRSESEGYEDENPESTSELRKEEG